MADTDIGWLHAQGLAALLEPLPCEVYIGEVTDADEDLTFPYLVLWPPPASRPTITLAGYGGEATTVTQLTAAGTSPRETITALDRAAARLHRQRPTIPGRRCSLITYTEGAATPPQPQPDPQARTPDGKPIYVTFAQFTLHSSPRRA